MSGGGGGGGDGGCRGEKCREVRHKRQPRVAPQKGLHALRNAAYIGSTSTQGVHRYRIDSQLGGFDRSGTSIKARLRRSVDIDRPPPRKKRAVQAEKVQGIGCSMLVLHTRGKIKLWSKKPWT